MRKMKTKIAGLLVVCILGGSLMVSGNADAASAGWQKNSKGWWYVNADGTYPKNEWKKIDGAWYFFDAAGFMVTGWKKGGSSWYYFNTNGMMQTGWKKIGTVWYYFNASGVMQTGWKKIGNAWYYLGTNGIMQTGWKKIGAAWYFFNANGAMQTGWKLIQGKWYFFNANGAMHTGWKKVSGVQYYFDASGAMVTGRQIIGDVLYFFENNGALDPKAYDFSEARVGDQIRFGTYEQDNDLTNGAERILWNVLDEQDGKLLLVSDAVLDCRKFQEEETDVTWGSCDLRAWLNGEFINTAFSDSEQMMIPLVTLENTGNEDWETEGSEPTEDQVFALSLQDVMEYYETEEYTYEYPLSQDFTTYEGSKGRAATPTAYAIAQGVQVLSSSEWYGGNCEYWLRTIGANQQFYTYVDGFGLYYTGGNCVDNIGVGVRPAIWVDKTN